MPVLTHYICVPRYRGLKKLVKLLKEAEKQVQKRSIGS